MAAAQGMTRAFWAILAALTALRVGVLMASQVELQFDEAQYWFWSLTPDWGYFSKPPLIAWAIGATTSLFGHAEWAVRLAAPLAQSAAAALIYFAAREMYGAKAAFWAGVGWLLIPAVWLSASIISTDALLMPCWALGLLALWRLTERGSWAWAVTLGCAIGVGMLAKYAMLYFLLSAGLAMLWAPQVRRALLSWRGLLALGVAAAWVAPNVAWNMSHSFATISHTAANSGLERLDPEAGEALEFLGGQALVFGPILFGSLLYLFWRAARGKPQPDVRERLLIAFTTPPLVIILVQQVLVNAHANWAVTAYPAAMIWVAGRFYEGRGRWALIAANVTHAVLGAVLVAATLSPSIANSVGLGNSMEDGRGWRQTAAWVDATARESGDLTAIAVDHRALFFELTYYWRRTNVTPAAPLRMWMLHADARNHAEAIAPLTPADGARVLVVHMQERYLPEVRGDFQAFRELGRGVIELGGEQERPLIFSLGRGFAPVTRDAKFEARVGE